MSTKGNFSLLLATGYHARARPLWEGRVDTGDLSLKVVPLDNDGERHNRFLAGEFDAAELSLAVYLALKSQNAPLAAIPVFPNRRFRHSFIYVREDSPVREPHELRGGSVGVPSYLNTCGLWVRGLLGDVYGIRIQDITWKALRREPIDFAPPPGTQIEIFSGKGDLRLRLLTKEVDALISPDILMGSGIRRLFSQPKELEKSYYIRTGIFPVNHAVVIREHVLREYPWLSQSLFDAWSKAKRLALEDDEDPTYSNFAWVRDLWEEERALFGPDPWPYGMTANERVVQTLIRYGSEQGILTESVAAGTLFLPVDEEGELS